MQTGISLQGARRAPGCFLEGKGKGRHAGMIRNDVRSQSANALLLIRKEDEGGPANLRGGGMGEGFRVRAPRGDNLNSDHGCFHSVSPKLYFGLVELRENPEKVRWVIDGQQGRGRVWTPRAGGGGPGGTEEEPQSRVWASGM